MTVESREWWERGGEVCSEVGGQAISRDGSEVGVGGIATERPSMDGQAHRTLVKRPIGRE